MLSRGTELFLGYEKRHPVCPVPLKGGNGMKKIYVSNHLCRKKLEGEEPTTAGGGNFVGPGVRNARKTVRWTVFSGERAAAQGNHPKGSWLHSVEQRPLRMRANRQDEDRLDGRRPFSR